VSLLCGNDFARAIYSDAVRGAAPRTRRPGLHESRFDLLGRELGLSHRFGGLHTFAGVPGCFVRTSRRTCLECFGVEDAFVTEAAVGEGCESSLKVSGASVPV